MQYGKTARLAMYVVGRNTEARSRNQCCHVKAEELHILSVWLYP
jgi:hypothetical protein